MKMNDYTFILEFKIIMLIVDFSVQKCDAFYRERVWDLRLFVIRGAVNIGKISINQSNIRLLTRRITRLT